jgi:hypothetical protein
MRNLLRTTLAQSTPHRRPLQHDPHRRPLRSTPCARASSLPPPSPPSFSFHHHPSASARTNEARRACRVPPAPPRTPTRHSRLHAPAFSTPDTIHDDRVPLRTLYDGCAPRLRPQAPPRLSVSARVADRALLPSTRDCTHVYARACFRPSTPALTSGRSASCTSATLELAALPPSSVARADEHMEQRQRNAMLGAPACLRAAVHPQPSSAPRVGHSAATPEWSNCEVGAPFLPNLLVLCRFLFYRFVSRTPFLYCPSCLLFHILTTVFLDFFVYFQYTSIRERKQRNETIFER